MTFRHSILAALLLALAGTLALAPAPPAQAQGPAKAAKSSRSKAKKPVKPTAEPDADAAPTAAPAADAEPSLRRSNRMELDARLIQGSTPEAGAVYLFQRAPRNLPALVRLRQSYLAEIVLPVLGADRLTPPAVEAKAP
jgi:hypothetical protein